MYLLNVVKKNVSSSFLMLTILFSVLCLWNTSSAVAQSVVTIQPSTNQSYQIAPSTYEYKCVFNEDATVYYIMTDGTIMGYDANGGLVQVGSKTAPPKGRETEFNYMVKLEYITYAVDHDGHIWQSKYPFKEIVGRTQKYQK